MPNSLKPLSTTCRLLINKIKLFLVCRDIYVSIWDGNCELIFNYATKLLFMTYELT